jgi:hypothetical protein
MYLMFSSLAGMSRSVTVAVAYIMTTTDLGWRDALNIVRVNRQCASPNFGFQKQLLAFQHEGVAQVNIIKMSVILLKQIAGVLQCLKTCFCSVKPILSINFYNLYQ